MDCLDLKGIWEQRATLVLLVSPEHLDQKEVLEEPDLQDFQESLEKRECLVCPDRLVKRATQVIQEEMVCLVYQEEKGIRELQEELVCQELLDYKESRVNLGPLGHLVHLENEDLQELEVKWEYLD